MTTNSCMNQLKLRHQSIVLFVNFILKNQNRLLISLIYIYIDTLNGQLFLFSWNRDSCTTFWSLQLIYSNLGTTSDQTNGDVSLSNSVKHSKTIWITQPPPPPKKTKSLLLIEKKNKKIQPFGLVSFNACFFQMSQFHHWRWKENRFKKMIYKNRWTVIAKK